MSRYGQIDYPTLTKRAFAFGAVLFLVGALGELIGQTFFGPLPGWESTLLFDAEILGIVIGLLSPIVFGVIMPLTE